MRPKGFIIDVPVTLSVAVRGVPLDKAKAIARRFADGLNPDNPAYCDGFTDGLHKLGEYPDATVTEATLESSREDACTVLEELEEEADDEDGEDDEPGDAGRYLGADGVVSVDWNV